MRWAKDREIAPVKGADLGDVQPFGQRHDAAVCEIKPGIGVFFHDFVDALDIWDGQRFKKWLSSGKRF
jgi:hypothetical protein